MSSTKQTAHTSTVREPARHEFQPRIRSGHTDARLQTRHHRQIVRHVVAGRIGLQRKPEIGFPRPFKTARGHPHHGVGQPAEIDFLADHLRIGGESMTP
jgi:hypothetical protein